MHAALFDLSRSAQGVIHKVQPLKRDPTPRPLPLPHRSPSPSPQDCHACALASYPPAVAHLPFSQPPSWVAHTHSHANTVLLPTRMATTRWRALRNGVILTPVYITPDLMGPQLHPLIKTSSVSVRIVLAGNHTIHKLQRRHWGNRLLGGKTWL